MFPRLRVGPFDAFSTDFSFVNYIEHKAEEIVGFYGDREHKFRCQAFPGKRRLNQVFDSMGLCYADRSSPSTSLPADNAATRGHGRGSRGEGAVLGKSWLGTCRVLLPWNLVNRSLAEEVGVWWSPLMSVLEEK